jgi:hypothetical protein
VHRIIRIPGHGAINVTDINLYSFSSV